MLDHRAGLTCVVSSGIAPGCGRYTASACGPHCQVARFSDSERAGKGVRWGLPHPTGWPFEQRAQGTDVRLFVRLGLGESGD
jgi:hypothetical protein